MPCWTRHQRADEDASQGPYCKLRVVTDRARLTSQDETKDLEARPPKGMPKPNEEHMGGRARGRQECSLRFCRALLTAGVVKRARRANRLANAAAVYAGTRDDARKMSTSLKNSTRCFALNTSSWGERHRMTNYLPRGKRPSMKPLSWMRGSAASPPGNARVSTRGTGDRRSRTERNVAAGDLKC